MFKTAQLRLSCWLAILAMLVLTLLPTITHAVSGPVDAGNWAELCSASGTPGSAQTHQGEGSGERSHGLSAQVDHCAACRIAIDAMDLAPAAVAAAVLPIDRAEPPEVILQAPRTLHVWHRARTRAPPALT
jgi:hypothetical protein